MSSFSHPGHVTSSQHDGHGRQAKLGTVVPTGRQMPRPGAVFEIAARSRVRKGKEYA
jgi:hypothetical protein